MAEPTQPKTWGHGGAGAPHTAAVGVGPPGRQECSQLPPPGYLIDSSNHPRWVDTLKSNQSLREPVAGDCHCCYDNGNLARPGVHLGPSPALWGWGHLKPEVGNTGSPTLNLRKESGQEGMGR